NLLFISEFVSDAHGIEGQVLRKIDHRFQVIGQLALRQGKNPSVPSDSGGDRFHPFGLSQRYPFSNIVNPAGGPLVGRRTGNGNSDIFDVAPGPAPPGSLLIQENGRTFVVHPFQKLKDAMLVIASSVNKGQTENSALNVRVTHDCLFHSNLLVVIDPVLRSLGFLPIRVDGLAERRVLSQRNRFQWPAINLPPAVVGPINIRAAHHHYSWHNAFERPQQRQRVFLGVGDHVDGKVGREPLKLILELEKLATVSDHLLHRAWKVGTRMATMENGYLVLGADQGADDMRSDEPCPADDQYFHALKSGASGYVALVISASRMPSPTIPW